MKFSTRSDTKASIEVAYAAFTDFDRFEYRLQRKDIEITRVPDIEAVEVGCRWHGQFSWRGRTYKAETELVSLDKPQGVALETLCRGVVCLGVIDLLALPEGGTRIFVSIDLKPTTLASRLLVQSLRFAKPRLTSKLESRVADFAMEIGH